MYCLRTLREARVRGGGTELKRLSVASHLEENGTDYQMGTREAKVLMRMGRKGAG